MIPDINRYRALLNDGSFIVLEKDCECVGLHDEPHWLNMDAYDKEVNRKMGADAVAANNRPLWDTYLKAEQRRLSEKLANLKKYGIAEIFPPGKPWPANGSVPTVTS